MTRGSETASGGELPDDAIEVTGQRMQRSVDASLGGITRRLRAAGCVFAEDEAELLAAEFGDSARVAGVAGAAAESLEDAVARRVAGEPLEQILGWAEFAGTRIRVLPGVFVPRLRTTAILTAVETLRRAGELELSSGSRVVDLCCGTGALGAVLAARIPGLAVAAADIDPVAVECARLNLAEAPVFVGDLFQALPVDLRGTVSLVVVNAPYVPTDEIEHMPPEARVHEHRVALDGGSDGLDLHRRIAREAVDWLRPGGALILETSRIQADTTRSFFPPEHWDTTIAVDDEVDGTVLIARRTLAS